MMFTTEWKKNHISYKKKSEYGSKKPPKPNNPKRKQKTQKENKPSNPPKKKKRYIEMEAPEFSKQDACNVTPIFIFKKHPPR